MPSYKGRLLVASSKATIGPLLHPTVISACVDALASRNVFTIALSGGSLPSFLASLSESFAEAKVDPQFNKWHVILADERCVPSTGKNSDDSNLRSCREKFLAASGIPMDQIYGIDGSLLANMDADPVGCTDRIAKAYQDEVVTPVLSKSGGMLDLALLGFGPDGHTCSLFPGHDLLKENNKLVAGIVDAPKPPPQRITLTFRVLNGGMTRRVVFCGAGSSKGPILRAVFATDNDLDTLKQSEIDSVDGVEVVYADPAPYPCGMVRPQTDDKLVVDWVVDKDALEGMLAVVGSVGECKL